MQKVVNLRLHAQQIVKNQTKKRRSAVNMGLCQGFNLLLSIGIMLFSLQGAHAQEANKISINIKEASIKSALTEVQKISGVKFSYGQDISKYADVKVTYDGKDKSVDEVVAQILKPTNLHAVKMDGYLVIEEKPAPQTTRSPNVQAGQGTGGIKGRIVEFETSDPLPGATVRILGQQQVMVSNENGYYHFPNAKAGRYTLEVSYIGFTTATQEVNIPAGRESTYDIKLQGSNTLEEVVISGIGKSRAPVAHTSNRQLIQEIKGMSVVASGISSQQISMTADRNAAQVMQRISGVTVVDDKFVVVRGLNQRYNLTYLNDNVAPSTEAHSRAFALDLIPSRVIDKVLVYKSPSPENLADATGGVVKIYTKDAKAVKHFDLEFQLGYRPGMSFNKNFMTYTGGKTDLLGFDDGTRALPNTLPGYGSLIKADYKPSQYAEMLNPTLTYGYKTALPNMQLTANYYNAYKIFNKTLSMLASLSYKNDNETTDRVFQQGFREASAFTTDKTGNETRSSNTVQTNMLLNFTYKWNSNNTFYFKNFLLQQGLNTTVMRDSWETTPTMGDVRAISKDITLNYNQRFLYGGNLSGKHQMKDEKQQFDWNVGYLYSQQEIPDLRVVRFRGLEQPYSMGDAELQWIARGDAPAGEGNYVDPIPKTLGIISRFWSRNSESVYNGALDYSYKIMPDLTAKIGTFQQWKTRTLDRRVYTIHEGIMDDPDLQIPKFSGYANPLLIRFRMQDLPNVWSDEYLRDDHSGLQVIDRTSGGDTYRGTEQNNSGYFLLNYAPANRFVEIHGGVRYEYNRQKIAAAIPPRLLPGINMPILVDNPMKSWLPSLNISLRPHRAWVGRASYGKTVNRTEFREVSPFKELDFANNTMIQGNPNLISATVDNYDARIEFYPNEEKADAISFGYFYKKIKNPIERTNTTDRVESNFPSISFDNANEATLSGWELELRKSFDFLPGNFFRNLSFSGNISWINSKVAYDYVAYKHTETGSRSDTVTAHRPLQGQAPFLINAGLYYENPGWGTKVGVIYNTVGENIYAVGREYLYNSYIYGPTYRGSLIELRRDLLDISVTQRIGKGLQVRLNVQNLLNEPITLVEDYNFTYKYEKGVTEVTDWNHISKSEITRKVSDNVSSKYKPGRYFSFNISYSF